MNTPNKDGHGNSLLRQLLQAPSRSSSSTSSTSAPSPMSAPSLSLWSRKLALQSEQLASLAQSSSTNLQEHQKALSDLLKSCKEDIANAKKETEVTIKKRDGEVDTHLNALRRLLQTTTDLLSVLEAKLSLLSTLPQLHKRLQSHSLIFRELVGNQEDLLHNQERLFNTLSALSAKQDKQAETLYEVLSVLNRNQENQKEQKKDEDADKEVAVLTVDEVTVKDSQPQMPQGLPKSKRQRRLLSDDEVLDDILPGSRQRVYSTELLSIEEVRRVNGAKDAEQRNEEDESGEVGGGSRGVIVERPLKRKLLSTFDMEQFEYTDGF